MLPYVPFQALSYNLLNFSFLKFFSPCGLYLGVVWEYYLLTIYPVSLWSASGIPRPSVEGSHGSGGSRPISLPAIGGGGVQRAVPLRSLLLASPGESRLLFLVWFPHGS